MGIHSFVIDGKNYEVEIGNWEGNLVQVTVNGVTHVVELKSRAVVQSSTSTSPPAASPTPSPTIPTPLPSVPAANGTPGDVRAPMAGQVLSITVRQGQSVKTGDELMVLEAMKMENKVHAHVEGIVEKVAVQVQQVVNRGDLLVTIRPT